MTYFYGRDDDGACTQTRASWRERAGKCASWKSTATTALPLNYRTRCSEAASRRRNFAVRCGRSHGTSGGRRHGHLRGFVILAVLRGWFMTTDWAGNRDEGNRWVESVRLLVKKGKALMKVKKERQMSMRCWNGRGERGKGEGERGEREGVRG